MIYLSAKVTAQARLRLVCTRLRTLGYECESSWLDEVDAEYPVEPVRARAKALRDFAEIERADVFLLDTLDESTTGGREVELGYALREDVDLGGPGALFWRVGPVRNVFHELADEVFATWEDVWTRL